MRRQLLVDQARNRLVGRGPVAVAAAEHRVAQPGEGIARQVAAEPFDEARGVVGRGAVIRGAEDQHAALLRQLACEIVERRQPRGKAVELGEIRDPGGELFGGAEIRAVQHQQRRVVSGTGPRPRRGRGGRCRRDGLAPSMGATVLLAARPHLDPEAVGLDGQRLLQHHLVAVDVDQLEALQDHADRKRRLVHGKAAADAGALAVPERLPGVDRARRLGLAAEILRVEGVRVGSPHAGVAMQRQHQHGDEGVLLEPVFAADGLVLQRRDAVGRRRRPQPQRFLQDLRDVGELGDLLIGRPGVEIRPEHAVDLRIGFLENVRMLEQRIQRARQQAAGGLVSGDQEGIDLVADVDVVQLLAGQAVDPGHHGAEHVLFVFGGRGVLAAFGHDLVDHFVHEGDIAGEIAPAFLHPQVFHRQAADHHDGLERAHQRLDERMIIAAIERIETVVETAQSDSVERQRGHVVNDVDFLVAVEPLPLLDQLVGDVDHARVVGLHGAVAERLQQDVVRLAPVRLGGVGGEQAVAGNRAHPAQRSAHRLVEPLLVAQFLDQIVAGDDDDRRPHHVEPEDRPELPGQPGQILHRRGRIQQQHVADHRFGRRLRDRTQSVGGRHRGSFPF